MIPSKKGEDIVDIQEIYTLMDHFERSSLSRMKLEMGEVKLALEKGLSVSGEHAGSFTGATGPAASAQRPASPEALGPAADKSREPGEELTEIKAPFVGTFYHAASPEDKPFVTLGQSVKKGQIIGIIEAMKLMNEIAAPEDGVVAAILAEDGALVEYNQTLMTLK